MQWVTSAATMILTDEVATMRDVVALTIVLQPMFTRWGYERCKRATMLRQEWQPQEKRRAR